MWHTVTAQSPDLLVQALKTANAPTSGINFVANEFGYSAFWYA